MTSADRLVAVCDLLVEPAAGLDELAVAESASRQLARLVRVDLAMVVIGSGAGAAIGSYPRAVPVPPSRILEVCRPGHLVDERDLAGLVPGAGPMLAAAFESASGRRGLVVAVDPIDGSFGPMEEWLVLVTARRVAAHLDVVSLHEARLADALIVEDATLAGEVQRAMLPNTPPVATGIDVAGVVRPARLVSGDFFDWAPTPGGLAAVVGDVSGKGAAAALLMASTQAVVRRALSTEGEDPAAVLVSVAGELAAILDRSERIVTLAAVHVGRDATVAIASAGHAPIVVAGDIGVVAFPATGAPLGVGSRWHRVETRVGRGGVVALPSDGVTDQRDRVGGPYGQRRLEDAVARACGGSSQAVVTAVLDDLDHHGAADQDDDQTLLVVRPIGEER